MSYGNLYVKFLVQMPKRGEISKDQCEQLEKVNFLLLINLKLLNGPKIVPI